MNPNHVATGPTEVAYSAVAPVSRKSVQIPIRFEPEDIERLEALREHLAKIEPFRSMRMSRAAFMRWAMIAGCEVIEERHQIPRPSTSPKKTSKR